MKHKSMMKHLLSVCLCTALALVCLLGLTVNAQAAEVTASGTCGDDLTWTLDSEGTLTISGTGAMRGYEYGFDTPWYENRESVNRIVIEDGVTNIGWFAFCEFTNLTSVIIPDSVTSIGSYAIYGCTSLTSVTIPDSVTSIEDSAFIFCTSLTGIWVDENNQYYCSDDQGVLFDKNKNVLIQAPSQISGTYIIPDSVTSIGYGAFRDCSSLTSVTIPDGITSIGWYAFAYCTSLTSVDIPDRVTGIERYAFAYCTSLTSVTIPDSVTSIGDGAFRYCTSLSGIWVDEDNQNYSSDDQGVLFDKNKNVLIQAPGGISGAYTIPDSVTSIGDGAFRNCFSLTSVTIPDGITSIEFAAFYNCTNLNSINFLGNAPTIHSSGFYNVTAIAYYPANNTTWTEDKLQNYGGTITWVATKGETTAPTIIFSGTCGDDLTWTLDSEGTLTISGTGAMWNYEYGMDTPWYENRGSVNRIVIEDGVTNIGWFAFCEFTNLTSVIIPDSVTGIGSYAFSGCSNLTSVTIPNGITSFGNSVFFNCGSLQYNIYDNAEYLGNADNLYVVLIKSISDDITSCEINTKTKIICDSAFSGCSGLTSVSLPDSITSIGWYAFAYCTNLITVNIPDRVSDIGFGTFENCTSLTSVNIPEGVTSIGNSAFSGCNILTTVTIPEGVTSIGVSAFSGCSGLTSVNIPDSVTFIGESAFLGCKELIEITIPDSVTSIGSAAFSGCSSLESMTIPFVGGSRKTATDTYQYPFGYIFGTSSYTGGTATEQYYYGSSTSYTTSSTYYIPSSLNTVTVTGGEILHGAFYKCTSLTSVDIPDSVTSIEYRAFYDCTSLTSVDIPDSVTSVGSYAFASCDSLTSVTIGNGVTSVGDYAFYYCPSLTGVYISDIAAWCNISFGNSSANPLDDAHTLYLNGEIVTDLVIPDGITAIQAYAFYNCSSLTSVTIPDSVTSIGDYAFRNCSSLTSVDIPDSVTSIGRYAFYGCSSLTSVTILDSVTSIGERAFFACSSLTGIWVDEDNQNYSSDDQGVLFDKNKNVLIQAPGGISGAYTIPDSVTSIGDYAFYYCLNLTSVTIPDSVTSIEDSAFIFCTRLTSVTIGNGVTSIGENAFDGCSSLTDVYISDIAAWCNISFDDYFANPLYYADTLYLNNEEITDLVIPDGVTVIPNYAFKGCKKMTSVTIPDSVTSIEGGAFEYCSSLTSVTIPDSVTSIGDYAFYYCTGLTSVTIPDGVTRIGDRAFYYCTRLASVTIPDSVTSIEYGAFSGCSSLKTVTIGDSVTSIGEYAFVRCSSLTSVIVPNSVTSIGNYAFSNCTSLNSINFIGNAPTISSSGFYNMTATAYYPANNATWTEDKLQNYGGTITWIAYEPVEITTQPKTAYAIIGDTVKTTVQASGNGLTYQWYIKNAGASSYTKSSVKTATYSCKMSDTTNGRYVRCKITDQYGNSVWTNTVRLKSKALAITTQPVSKTVKNGTTAKFSVTPNGTNVTYQWQYRTSSSGSWKNASATGNKTKTLSVAATVAKHGYQYRCKITDTAGNTVYTKVVNLYVLGIKTQPVNKAVKAGATAKFTVAAVGDGLTYQWQYRTSSSGSWKNASATGNKTKTLSVAATVAKHGYQYRCKITDTAGNTVYTSVVTLNVLGIKTQPASKTVKAGATAKFTVAAVGDGLTYQWQYRTSSSGSWKNASATGNKTKTLSVAATVVKHGYQYRCKVTDTAGNTVYTSVVNLYVLGIKTQPANKTVKAGATAKLTVAATGKGLTYQWQYRTSSSGSWKNVSTASGKTANYSLTAAARHNGYQYRCKITDSAGNVIYTSIVKLTVK